MAKKSKGSKYDRCLVDAIYTASKKITDPELASDWATILQDMKDFMATHPDPVATSAFKSRMQTRTIDSLRKSAATKLSIKKAAELQSAIIGGSGGDVTIMLEMFRDLLENRSTFFSDKTRTIPGYRMKSFNDALQAHERAAFRRLDDALSRIKRGHTVADSITATKDLKDRGFKVSYHMMPGLPGVGRKKDIIGLRKIFDDSNFRPDMLKIYPCMVLPGTELHDDWADGSYIPLSTGSAAGIIAEFKRHVPEYVRIMRVQRDIPSSMVSAGVDRTNLRQYVSRLMEEKGISCRCIRCREAGRNDASASDYAICKRSYDSSGGTEVFISAESGDSVLGFVRLRIPGSFPRKEITKSSAIIRELHVYGAASALGRKGPIQHRGIGKRLLREAENEAVSSGKREVIVIAGVGAREYYRRLGYRKKGPYMVRKVRS